MVYNVSWWLRKATRTTWPGEGSLQEGDSVQDVVYKQCQ